MKILAIDYGKTKVGLALGDTVSGLAEPWKILRYKEIGSLINNIKTVVEDETIEKIVIGIVEGAIGAEARKLGVLLQSELVVAVEFVDETLTTKDAQRLSIEAGINRKKRRAMEDAYAAALILQYYFDNNVEN
jgi:putative Holliday junction resolvase